jgi:predicted dehydrogenase
VTRYRAAIVGLSWIGADPPLPAADPVLGSAVPGSHASAMAEIDRLDVVAGCDVAEAARTAFAERWDDRWPGLRTYGDYRELLEAERPEIVSIVTPDHLHAEVFHAAIATGARGIFCEKPLSTDLAEADEMVAAAEREGVAVNVNYTRRWLPESAEARRLLREGACGPLSHVVAQRGGPRAMLWRNHGHLIDLLCYLVEDEPEWVTAELEPGWAIEGDAYVGDGGDKADSEPGANVCIAFRNGVRAFLIGMKTGTSDIVVDVVGATARIAIDPEGLRLVQVPREDWRVPPADGDRGIRVRTLEPRFRVVGMEAALRELLHAVETGAATTSPATSARTTVAVIQAALASAAAAGARTEVPR